MQKSIRYLIRRKFNEKLTTALQKNIKWPATPIYTDKARGEVAPPAGLTSPLDNEVKEMFVGKDYLSRLLTALPAF